MATKITAQQIGGDDGYHWCILVNGRVIVNGLTKHEVPHYRAQAEQKYLSDEERAKLTAKRQKARARHWSKTGVSDATVKWMKENVGSPVGAAPPESEGREEQWVSMPIRLLAHWQGWEEFRHVMVVSRGKP